LKNNEANGIETLDLKQQQKTVGEIQKQLAEMDAALLKIVSIGSRPIGRSLAEEGKRTSAVLTAHFPQI